MDGFTGEKLGLCLKLIRREDMNLKNHWMTKASVVYNEVVKDHLTGKPKKWGLVEVRMITCKQCKYWGSENEIQMWSAFYDVGYNDCLNESLIYYEHAGPKDAITFDGYWGRRGFSTGPDFGCIHGERDTE